MSAPVVLHDGGVQPFRLAELVAGLSVVSDLGKGLGPDLVVHGGDLAMVMWTEHGTVYWLFSKQRDVFDLVRIANTLH